VIKPLVKLSGAYPSLRPSGAGDHQARDGDEREGREPPHDDAGRRDDRVGALPDEGEHARTCSLPEDPQHVAGVLAAFRPRYPPAPLRPQAARQFRLQRPARVVVMQWQG
jgi:hypothetical protein